MHKARLSLNWSCEILACERRQTEESQYYEEGCLYGTRDNWLKVGTEFFYVALNMLKINLNVFLETIFEVVQNSHADNLSDLKFDMHVW